MRWARRGFMTAAAALAVACAHRPPPAPHTARLVVQSSPRGVRSFVRAKVAGESMMLLVDTGAVQSMLPARFARAHNLRRQTSASDEHILDANGRITRMPVLPDVPVQFDGESSADAIDFLMNPSGSMEEGILVPQDLVRRGWAVVIDLERGELRYEPEEIALKRSGADGPPLREVDFHRCLDEGLFNRSHRVVRATINGVSAEMFIDTGAATTVLARNNPALPSMVSMMGQRGTTIAIGSLGQGLLVDGVSIVFSEATFVMPAVVLPASLMCGQGLLGADVLRHCTLVWGWSSLWATCRAPAEGH